MDALFGLPQNKSAGVSYRLVNKKTKSTVIS